MSLARNIIRSTITRLPREASRQFTNISLLLKSNKDKDKEKEELIILLDDCQCKLQSDCISYQEKVDDYNYCINKWLNYNLKNI
tara:strand:+ start:188 stop:439 length:252 start_codon:yes stop_codon:yes gene_type:complete